MLFKRILLFALLFWNTLSYGQQVFFNEIDHLNPDLCVEIAAAPGYDLTNWFVTLYDETGVAFDTISLTGVTPTSITPSGYNIIEVDIVFLSNTDGGVTLVDNNDLVVQFISHDGPLTAVDGPSAGQSAEYIGTQTASGNSLQLQGVGSEYSDFTWGVPGNGTCGFENDGQVLLAPEDPLPVELLYFEANIVADHVALKWATASESNNQYFAIEKSSDGLSFEEIARIPGAINSNIFTDYFYLDYTPLFAETYYRLAQVDTDGTVFYSELVVVYFENWAQQIRIFPNPVANQLNIFIPQSSDKTEIVLYNLLGKKVLQKTVESATGQTIIFEMSALPAGSYILSIDTGQLQHQEKIIKGF